MNELISVIITIYNGEEYLRDCIESVLNQTYKNLEIILIDDGSIDRSGLICEEYRRADSRIKVYQQKNRGVSVARNKGLELACGKYIGFVDQDDYVEPNFYYELLRIMKKNGLMMSMVAYTQTNDIFHNQSKHLIKERCYGKEEAIRLLLQDNIIKNYVWNKLYTAELIKQIRFPEGVLFEDVIGMYDIICRTDGVAYLDMPLYYYRNRNDSIIHKVNHSKFVDEMYVIKKRYEDVKLNYPELSNENAYGMILWMCRIFIHMTLEDDSQDAFLRDNIPILANCWEFHKKYIIEHLSVKKLIVLLLMISNIDKGKRIIKLLYEE